MPYNSVGNTGLRMGLAVCVFLVYAYVIKIAAYAFSGCVDLFFMLLTLVILFLLAIWLVLPMAISGRKYPLAWIIFGFMLINAFVFGLSLGISIILGGFVWNGNWDILNYEHVYLAYIATNLFSFLYYMVRGGIFNWEQVQQKNLEILQIRNQIKFLRQQVSRQHFFPHFMKNTLSVLRALGRRDKVRSIRCTDLLLALFTYCVKHQDTRLVLLEEELQQVDHLLEIYSLRRDNDIMLDIRKGTGVTNKLRIPYMLLLTLIENACEYGICTDEHKPILIDLYCITSETLIIRAINQIPENKRHNPASTGKGLKLLQEYVTALDPMNTITFEQKGQCFEVVIVVDITCFSKDTVSLCHLEV